MFDDLERNIGYSFQDKTMLRLALTHPSARYEHKLPDDNQRLEFLGDAALSLVAAEHGYRHADHLPEGKLTLLRSSVTSTSALADIARGITLGCYLALGKGEDSSGGRDKENNLADALEALMGACYLDGGLAAVRRVFETLFAGRPDVTNGAEGMAHPKGLLQERAQARNLPPPTYNVISEEGPPHQRVYTIEVTIDKFGRATGQGNSKRNAEADAASQLLKIF